MRKKYYLILDIGTSGTKGVLFNETLQLLVEERIPLTLFHPKKDWVEQDPIELVKKSIQVLKKVLKKQKISASEIISFGITNQRETTILWDTKTGKPVYPAIVWQDVRTKALCKSLKKHDRLIREKTGLSLDPYFSASKIDWILTHVPSAKLLHAEGRLKFGTVDTWVIWNLTRGESHVTDETNASRTLVFDIKKREWGAELLRAFHLPTSIFPIVKKSQDDFGIIDEVYFGSKIPIRAVCGDQQSSLYAAGVKRGVTKITYGTGTFIGQHLGNQFELQETFFTTMMPSGKKAHYALEGKITHGGKEVEPLLGEEKKLRTFLLKLAKWTDVLVKKLPIKPKKIFIDGGVMKDGIIGAYQQDISQIKIEPLAVVNGTAFGTAKLLAEQNRD